MDNKDYRQLEWLTEKLPEGDTQAIQTELQNLGKLKLAWYLIAEILQFGINHFGDYQDDLRLKRMKVILAHLAESLSQVPQKERFKEIIHLLTEGGCTERPHIEEIEFPEEAVYVLTQAVDYHINAFVSQTYTLNNFADGFMLVATKLLQTISLLDWTSD